MYILSCNVISPQLTQSAPIAEQELIHRRIDRFLAQEPDYSAIIPSALLRRMGKAVRMGVGAALPLIASDPVDGIIIGTANGGLEDCIRFLNQIVDYDEGMLTPTNFVQSTPNALAGQLAMMTKNNGYNITHTNSSLAFENSVLDALMLFEEGNAETLLLGAIEEISEYNYNIDLLSGCFKEELVDSRELLSSVTPGSVCGEGAAMFRVAKEAGTYLAKIADVAMVSSPGLPDVKQCLQQLLERNGLDTAAIGVVISGRSGDGRYDDYYTAVESEFPEATVYCYKHLVGEYRTCAAFGTWLGAQVLNNPENVQREYLFRKGESHSGNAVVYSRFLSGDHGFILLSD